MGYRIPLSWVIPERLRVLGSFPGLQNRLAHVDIPLLEFWGMEDQHEDDEDARLLITADVLEAMPWPITPCETTFTYNDQLVLILRVDDPEGWPISYIAAVPEECIDLTW